MPNVALFDMAGNKKGEIELKAEVFGCEVNEPVLHSVVRAYLLNQRQGTQSTKTRAEVSGGGIKPWRQKGTGRARQGSTRSPQWTHGGIAFGPKPRSWRVSINKKVKRIAMKSALSSKVADNEMAVIEDLKMDEFKTKTIVNMLKGIGAEKKALIVTAESDKFVAESASNIPGVKTATPGTLNVYDILNCDMFVVAKDAVSVIEEVYA
ncbi:MAG: 50S ribosomal protein L4 [Clostridia bacterium]|nr:50S ribosomal protein L4 [Clostridia bacterium]MBR5721452.1 50S ribosomal protein L4 [Clostridia bacterium]